MSFSVRQLEHPVSDTVLEAILDTQASAFAEDPFAYACIDGDKSLLKSFVRSVVIAGFLGGEVYVAENPDKQIIGASVWFPPSREMFDSEDQRKQGLDPLFAQFSPDHLKWWLEYFLPNYAKLTTDTLGDEFKLANWHLQWIGVIPEERKKGVARELIEPVRIKKGDKAMCLETESEENLVIYDKLGFSSKGQTDFKNPRKDFTMWVLVEKE
ncbi:hypothetical protein D9758_009969 [Tetrapyrgos nigripes]|uniref:N-acetyltransferase domain-containing protein n=1 Tax=Tetrapyrgos nigripes TaxID=182062 RepID=A0A8H5CRQ6_9AGAR|nr:hypothetical protein D9758_009969 [Tetrapyrgos nigripes]